MKIGWISWVVLAALTIFLGWFLLRVPVQLGGDIAEYYGITESVLRHGSVELRADDQAALEKVLHPAYFSDPGYYIAGRNDQRYPVHFVVYSYLAVPIRVLLQFMGQNPIRSLYFVNAISFLLMVAVIWRWYLKNLGSRLLFLSLAVFSPLQSFFIWPGPDLWFVAVLIVGIMALLNQQMLFALALTTVASWHSQPLLLLAAGIAAYYCIEGIIHPSKDWLKILLIRSITSIAIGAIGLLPYAYNWFAFGVLTPWTLFQDGWTQLNGFGFQNMSVLKLYEQFFDLNIGLFWYSFGLWLPLLYFWGRGNKQSRVPMVMFSVGLLLITALGYHTNPGWHYGTAGYGPSRHILFAVAFLLAWLALDLQSFKTKNWKQLVIYLTAIGIQIWLGQFNNYFNPNLEHTLYHSPLANFVLSNYPSWYQPTPEIFVDRTNHRDVTRPDTAIFRDSSGHCRKVYALTTDSDAVLRTCGTPQIGILDNPFGRFASYDRKTRITTARFWPTAEACQGDYVKTSLRGFYCIQDEASFTKLTGLDAVSSKVTLNPETELGPGIWSVSSEAPIVITVPAGYSMEYTSYEGNYATY